MRHRDRGGGVERVVPSRHRKHQSVIVVRGIGLRSRNATLKLDPPPVGVEIDQPRIGLRIFAVGDDAAILDLADDSLHHRMVDAHHRKAVERHVLDEIAERVLHRLEGLEVVEVLRIDIGDDGDIGRHFRKVPSLSSASTTIHSPALAGHWCRRRLMMPPLITVGSRSPASSKAATIEVVVVLPWVPAIATQLFSRISSASISGAGTTGMRGRGPPSVRDCRA